MNNARTMIADILDSGHVTHLASMVKEVSAQSSALPGLDPPIMLDIACLENCEAMLDQCVEKRILACLPSQPIDKSFNQSSLELSAMQDQDIMKRVSADTCGKLSSTMELVTNMSRGISPDTSFCDEGSFYSRILDRMAWFCSFTGQVGKMPAAHVRGPKSLLARFDHLKGQLAKSGYKDVRLSELDDLHAAKWLLTSDQKKTLGLWAREIVKANKASKASASAASSSAPPAACGGKKKGKAAASSSLAESSSSAELMKFFA